MFCNFSVFDTQQSFKKEDFKTNMDMIDYILDRENNSVIDKPK